MDLAEECLLGISGVTQIFARTLTWCCHEAWPVYPTNSVSVTSDRKYLVCSMWERETMVLRS